MQVAYAALTSNGAYIEAVAMNFMAMPRAQRLHRAAAELAAAESTPLSRARLQALRRALLLEPVVALSQRWQRALAPLVAALPAPTASAHAPRRYLVLTCEPLIASGSWRYARDVLAAMLADGHTLDFCVVPGVPPVSDADLASWQIPGGDRLRVATPASMGAADALIGLPGWSGARLAMLSGIVALLQIEVGRPLPFHWLASDHVPTALGPYVDVMERRALDDATRQLAMQADATAVVSAQERAGFVAASCADTRLRVVAPRWYRPTPDAARPFAERAHLAFVGAAHASNAEGLGWFINHVWPVLRAQWPTVALHLLGRDIERLWPDACALPDGVCMVGAVPDLAEALSHYRLAVAPMRQGGGVRIKVLDSFAAGTPVVATTRGAAGLAWPGTLPPTQDDAVAFAATIARYGRDESLWQRAHETLLEHGADSAHDTGLRTEVRAWLGAAR